MRRSIILLAVMIGAAAVVADVSVIPLAEVDDPIRLSNGRFDLQDPARPALVVDLENTTTQPISTAQVWLSMSRFFTKSETIATGDRIALTCGKVAHADIDGRPEEIPPGRKVSVKLFVVPTCKHDLQHQHFYIYVTQLSVGRRYGEAAWKREPGDAMRLLHAAMPHD